MIAFVPFKPEHVRLIVPQGLLDYEWQVAVANADALAAGVAITGTVDGKCVGAAGFVELWPGRVAAWALLSPATGPHMMAITRFARRIMASYAEAGTRRFEATVLWDYAAGWRWARALGMALETPDGMAGYGPQGQRMALFARVFDERA